MSRVRVYGPIFAYLYGIDEDTVIDTWSVDRFERYRAAADQLLELKK